MIALACFLLGPAFLLLGLRAYRVTSGSENWPKVEGVIYSSEVRQPGNSRDRKFYLVIKYRYKVDGRNYENNVIYFQTNTGTSHLYPIKGKSGSLFSPGLDPDDYKVNQEVTVYYKPNQPEVAALRPGVNPGILSMVISGGIMTFIFTVLLVRALREKKQHCLGRQ